MKQAGSATLLFENRPYVLSAASTAGKAEEKGPFGHVFDEIMEEEENIDLMTDALSKYMVELLPFLESQETLNILNQYYKVVTEFERLGDHAVNIAENAAEMSAKRRLLMVFRCLSQRRNG